jgi:hypothetical protein
MKTVTLLILLSLAASLNTVYATEESTNADDITAYCTEQAQLAGIEDATELKQYMQDCVDSYTGTTGE